MLNPYSVLNPQSSLAFSSPSCPHVYWLPPFCKLHCMVYLVSLFRSHGLCIRMTIESAVIGKRPDLVLSLPYLLWQYYCPPVEIVVVCVVDFLHSFLSFHKKSLYCYGSVFPTELPCESKGLLEKSFSLSVFISFFTFSLLLDQYKQHTNWFVVSCFLWAT